MTQQGTEPLVLIPDRLCDARMVLDQVAALAGQFPVMVMPLPAEDSVAAMAKALALDLPPVVAVAGLGLGGAVAIELARSLPDRVTRLALLATDPLPEPPRVAAAREPRVALARAGRLADVLAEELDPQRFADLPQRAAQLATMRAVGLAQGVETYVAHTRAQQRRPDQQSTLRRLSLPVLVLAGEEDAVIPPRRQTLMADLLPWSELVLLPEAGHLPGWDQPDLTNAALQAWMQIGR